MLMVEEKGKRSGGETPRCGTACLNAYRQAINKQFSVLLPSGIAQQ
jgi:hypothetical protein